jgi:heavy metal translocating P-type ATPase
MRDMTTRPADSPPTRSSRDPLELFADAIDRVLLPLAIVALLAGAALHLGGQPDPGNALWAFATLLAAVRLLDGIISDLRAGRAGVDLIAILAMLGAVAFGELLAGAVIAVMYATGQALERFAEGRAERELTALLSRSPGVAHRYEDGGLVTGAVDTVKAGDRLLIKPGEVVPVDGLVGPTQATLDESALTGESRLVTREPGDAVSSGVVNAGGPFDLLATATAEASTFAGIIRLVREAQATRAPFVRLADRYAVGFTAVSLALAAGAWLASGDPVRGLAVLVVATPCPLLLAAPIAIVAGISRAARRGIIVKGGAALESLAEARVLLMDKTGTLTAGTPRLARIEAAPGHDPREVLRLAASLDQVSPHVLAGAIVRGARDHGLVLEMPGAVEERPGAGIGGQVGARRVVVGNRDFATSGSLPEWARPVRGHVQMEGATAVHVVVDGTLAGVLVLEDPIRAEAPRALRHARRAGIQRIVMITGDHPAVAETVGAALGVDGILAERAPAEKVEAVHAERINSPGSTAMIGDGINDAPALAAADVGIAMGARGATASSEAADVVITVDRLDRLGEAIRIAKRARGIALESVVVGIGLSLAAMVAAALGFLPPVAGAVLQEGIDVVVILNALRALTGAGPTTVRLAGWGATRARLDAEHVALRPVIDGIRDAADRLDRLPGPEIRTAMEALGDSLEGDLLRHEQLEETTVYPALAKAFGGEDPLAVLSASHREIFHLVRLLRRRATAMEADGPNDDEVRDLRRILYGLHAILVMHFAQEEEIYLAVGDSGAREAAPAVA